MLALRSIPMSGCRIQGILRLGRIAASGHADRAITIRSRRLPGQRYVRRDESRTRSGAAQPEVRRPGRERVSESQQANPVGPGTPDAVVSHLDPERAVLDARRHRDHVRRDSRSASSSRFLGRPTTSRGRRGPGPRAGVGAERRPGELERRAWRDQATQPASGHRQAVRQRRARRQGDPRHDEARACRSSRHPSSRPRPAAGAAPAAPSTPTPEEGGS